MPNPIRSNGYLKTLPVLVAARQGADLTQQQLADRLGRPQSYVSKIERGERRLDIAEFCQLATVLGISPTALLRSVVQALND